MKIERLKVYRPQKDWVTVHVLVPIRVIAEAKRRGVGLRLFINNLLIDAVNNNFRVPKK